MGCGGGGAARGRRSRGLAREDETAAAAPVATHAVQVRLLRDGQLLEERCDTLALDGLGTQAVVGWAGLLLQRTPDAVRSQRSVAGRGAFSCRK